MDLVISIPAGTDVTFTDGSDLTASGFGGEFA